MLSGLGAASADAVYGGIAGFGLASLSGLLLGWLVLGAFLGSLLWWLLLALVVGTLRRRLTPAARRWLNRAAGTVIALFGALALLG